MPFSVHMIKGKIVEAFQIKENDMIKHSRNHEFHKYQGIYTFQSMHS